MKIGVDLMLWTSGYTGKQVKLVEKVARMGFDGVEFPIFNPTGVDVAATRRALEGAGLGATVCTVMVGGSLIAGSAKERNAGLKHVLEVLDVAKAIGADCVAGPIYSPVGYLPGRGRNEAEWKRAVTMLRKIGRHAEAIGIGVGIEPLNRFETYFLNTVEDALRLCREVASPNVGVHYDTFHANIEEKDPVSALRKVPRKWLTHVHASENDRGIPGTGHVPWKETVQALKAAGYDRWVTIESFVPAIKELARAASIWRSLAKDGDELARRGLSFLRNAIR
jgi:D-psicose/D-tagatose/L-ribulose 3-epimerase